MEKTKLTKLITDVFAPRSTETVLLLYDLPTQSIPDNPAWQARRKMTEAWQQIFTPLVKQADISQYPATGRHNGDIPSDVIELAQTYDIIIAMTEYSASAPLKTLTKGANPKRVASMPTVEKRMENTAFQADYSLVKKYALAIKELLTQANSADVLFSSGDKLHFDLRYRDAEADKGECSQPGQFINFPSGEAFIVPYEASPDEAKTNGSSQTSGVWPIMHDGVLLKLTVAENKITDIVGPEPAKTSAEKLFSENPTRRNIAELGIGCNPNAVVSGNVLEDEKVGLHIAYGTSSHFTGGTVTSDMHEDIVYAKGCPIEGTSVVLNLANGKKVEIIKNSEIQYNLLND